MKVSPIAVYLGIFSLAVGGCSQEGASNDTASVLGPGRVAVVNGRPVAESVLRVYALASDRKNLDDLGPEDRERLTEDLIGVELLAQQAEKDGLTDSRALAAQLELQRQQMVARAAATRYLENNPPTELELQQLYDENVPRLSDQQYKARHILVESREEADAVIAQLRGGSDFTALALERADGPTGPNGGALDWFSADSMPQPFADAVRSMAVGTYSPEPVRTDFGYHVILLEETRMQEPPSLADVREQLVRAVEGQKLEAYIQSLRETATITRGP